MRLYKILLFSLLICQLLIGQNGNIVPLSQKVGTTIDAEENLIYGIFTEIRGFESAQVFEISENEYQVRYVIIEQGRRVTREKSLTWNEFFQLKQAIDKQPVISAADRAAVYQDLNYLRTTDIVESIPTGQFVKIKHVNGRTIRGILLPFEDNLLRIQTPIQVLSFPYHEVQEIAYRKEIKERPSWRKWIFASAAAGGLMMAEIWNTQVAPQNDLGWHYRFLGTILGLIGGQEIIEAVDIIFSPQEKFEIAPNL